MGRTSGVVGFFEDEFKLLEAAEKTYGAGYRKYDAITPFPIHGMDDAMGLKRSIVPIIAFVGGAIGCAFGVWFQWWASAVDWPLNIAGKPMFSLPAFVPVIFELTILICGLSTLGGLLVLCGLPKVDPPVIDPGLSCSKFALFVPQNDLGYDQAKVEAHFKSIGATEVRHVAEY